VLAYAGVGVLWLATRESVENVVDQPDYGVSAVWLAVLGALLVTSIRSLRAGRAAPFDRLVILVCPLAAVIGFVSFPLLSGTEHLLAFLAGIVVVAKASGLPVDATRHAGIARGGTDGKATENRWKD
jgi:membrane associated rhomboid family serine protease